MKPVRDKCIRTSRGHARILAAAVSGLVLLLVVGLALSGCGASEKNQAKPSGTQFAESSESIIQEDADESRQSSDATGKTSSSKTYRELKRKLSTLAESYGDKVAIAVMPVDGDDRVTLNGDKRFVSASMIKLLILAEFIDEVGNGVISLDDVYTSKASDIVGGTGVIQTDPVGTSYTYDRLAELMIASSDNVATNVLIDRMGFDAINGKAHELGLEKTKLNRKMMQLGSEVENYTSANDAALILRKIARNELGSKKLCSKAKRYLLQQTDDAGLAQGLPSDVSFAHKTGSLDSKRHDGGIVYGDCPYVLVVLTDVGAGQANQLMSKIASATYQQLGKQKRGN